MNEPLPPGQQSLPERIELSVSPGSGRSSLDGSTPALMLSFSPSVLAQAKEQLSKGECRLAVLLAYVACELRTEEAIVELMRHRRVHFLTDALLDMFDTMSLRRPQLRKVFTALTDHDPAQAPWWSQWMEGGTLRNDIAHEGRNVEPAQAQKCVALAETCIEHIHRAVAAARAR
jgi:hypothetical protein